MTEDFVLKGTSVRKLNNVFSIERVEHKICSFTEQVINFVTVDNVSIVIECFNLCKIYIWKSLKWIIIILYLSRNCRFISTTNSLNCVPRKSKIVSDKKITPREYHDDKVSETSSENPLHFSSTRAILGPRVDALGTGMICITGSCSG